MINLSKVAIAGLLITTSLSAHQIFTVQQDKGYELKFWADDHWEEIKSDNVVGVSAFDKDGKQIKAGYDYKNNKIQSQGEVALSVVMYDLGYYSFTQNEHFNKPRNEVSGTIYDTRRNLKFGKSVFSWSDELSKPVGLKLEITPLQNPLNLKQGDKLKVLVTLDGKPFSGASFEDQNDDLDIKADEDGIAHIPLSAPRDGLSIIAAGVKLPFYIGDKLAQTLQLTCTLSFKQAK
ncbi:DUF4198 domain-containing protein [Campylobacter sp. 19-13652]|uniref:DUF4198 domain-containing protein n=1 Tax=Campylobacter sp. 19-13652 TaxID=2840180 RepID=UPI001C78E055|nr:DUF4198 domain-containing protein [Campylobacter sp. 19-13652]BCX80076.1 hypothetical protein LBC_15380 [Campylobacter sp. 19-13652]